MDGLSAVYIEEVVAPAVRKVTSRIVKIDRQNSIEEALTQLQNLSPASLKSSFSFQYCRHSCTSYFTPKWREIQEDSDDGNSNRIRFHIFQSKWLVQQLLLSLL